MIVNPSTLAPVLIALGAMATVLGPKGQRTIALDKFFLAPTTEAEREHVLAPNEVVLSVTIPASAAKKNASYEVRHKQAYDWPLAQAAVSMNLADGKASDVKIVLGHVAPTPHVAEAAAKALEEQGDRRRDRRRRGKAAGKGQSRSSKTPTRSS